MAKAIYVFVGSLLVGTGTALVGIAIHRGIWEELPFLTVGIFSTLLAIFFFSRTRKTNE